MKWMIASDLHGSAYYCKKMVEAFEREGADRLLMLGDLLYHGPRNDLPRGLRAERGHPDAERPEKQTLLRPGQLRGEVDQMVLDFPILADYALLYAGSRTVFATHGHHYNTACPTPLAKGDILLHGHTHVPAWQEFGSGNLYLNPGSVAIPKENSAHSYMMLTDSGFAWKDLEGSIYHTLALDCPNCG